MELFKNIQKLFLSGTSLQISDFKNLVEYVVEQINPTAAQQQLLEDTVLHPLNIQYPVKDEFQKHFLKRLISQLEASGVEVFDNLYDEYIKKINRSSEHQDYHYCHFKVKENFITLRESTKLVSEGTTGLLTWEGGQALAEWCLQNPSEVSNKRILELGCGLGLTGLAVCATVRPAPTSYTLTDCHPSVLAALEHNLHLNRELVKAADVTTAILDWEDLSSSDLKGPFDLVLAADVVYDERLFPALIDTLTHFLSIKSTRALLACTERNPDTLAAFLQCLRSRGFEVEEQTGPQPLTFSPRYSLNTRIRMFFCHLGGHS